MVVLGEAERRGWHLVELSVQEVLRWQAAILVL